MNECPLSSARLVFVENYNWYIAIAHCILLSIPISLLKRLTIIISVFPFSCSILFSFVLIFAEIHSCTAALAHRIRKS